MKRKSFILLWFGTFALLASLSANSVIFPLWMDQAGYDSGTIGLIVGSAALGALLGRISLGWGVDRWGTRLFLLAGALIWLIVSPAAGLTTQPSILLLYRLLQGFGAALFTSGALGFVIYVVPTRRRGEYISWWDSSGSVANLIAPVTAAFLIDKFGFPGTFAITGVAAGVSLLAVFNLPQASPIQEELSVPRPGFRFYTSSAILPGFFALALGYAAGALLVLSPLIARLINLENVGFYLMAFSFGTLVVRPITGRLSDRFGRSSVILPGFLIMTLALSLLPELQTGITALTVPLLFGIGLSSALPGIMAWNGDRALSSQQGLAASTLYAFWESGIFVGASIQGQLLESSGLISFWMPAILLAVFSAGYLITENQRRYLPDKSGS